MFETDGTASTTRVFFPDKANSWPLCNVILGPCLGIDILLPALLTYDSRTPVFRLSSQTELSIATSGRSWTSSDGIRGPENSAIEATFADWPGPVDFLTDPSFMTESGLGRFFGAKKLSGQASPPPLCSHRRYRLNLSVAASDLP